MNQYAIDFEHKYATAYLLNDPAHRVPHFREVLNNCIMVHERLFGNPPTSVHLVRYTAAAYIHDLFAWSRINHHILSHEYVVSGDCELLALLKPDARKTVAQMCLEHRASFKGEFTDVYSELFNVADMGPPNMLDIYNRAFQYTKAKTPTAPEHYWHTVTVQHLRDKFGRHGYANRGELYQRAYGNELEALYTAIDELK